jgi:hypothetical protein
MSVDLDQREVQAKAWEIQQSIKELDNKDYDKHKLIRQRIMELCEDIILISPTFGAKAKVDEIMWNNSFYSRLERLKADVRKFRNDIAMSKLNRELEFAKSFYKLLILSLSSYYIENNEGVEEERTAARFISAKSLIFLGDLERYRISFEKGDAKNWADSWIWYEKSFALYPKASIIKVTRQTTFSVGVIIFL